MTTRRRNSNPWLLLAVILVVIGASAANQQPGRPNSLLAGVGGALGCAIALQLTHLSLLLGRSVGHTAWGLSLGSGRRLAQWRLGGLLVTLRWLPVPLLLVQSSLIERPGLRLRLWLSNLVVSALQLGLGLWLVLSDTWFLRFLGVGELLLPLLWLTLLARVPLSAGWVLFRMPFLPPQALAGFTLRPAEVAAATALHNGRAGAAEQALRELPAGAEPSVETYRLRAMIALTEGRHADAAVAARQSAALAPHRTHAALSHFILAGAIVGAAEAGELPNTEYLPLLSSALESATTPRSAATRAFPAAADLARLENDHDTAVKLARTAVHLAVDNFWLAQAECSYAAALAADGRAEDARAALERARKAMPELARIATVAQRLGFVEVGAEPRP